MKNLNESELVLAFYSFLDEIMHDLESKNISVHIESSNFNLILDDRKIDSQSDIELTNGRYYFKEYSDFYIPHSNESGVYIFFNIHKNALYVGKSDNKIGKEVWRHIKPKIEFPDSEYCVIIPFTKNSFLSSSFEGYLLSNYSFKYNIIHNS